LGAAVTASSTARQGGDGGHARTLLGKPTADAVKQCGFARAAVLATASDYRIAVMAAAGIRVLWSDGGESFERGVLAVEVAGTVIVAAHLNAHSAAARHREAQIVASLLPALRRLAVRMAGAGERLSKWGCAAVGTGSGDAEADANACAERVPVVMAGDLNTLSPLDADCHNAEGLERWIEQGALPGGRLVPVPARLRIKYLRDDKQHAIDYRPMRALLTAPQGPPPPLQLGPGSDSADPAWWSGATWFDSGNGRTMGFAGEDSPTDMPPFDDDASFTDAVDACSQGRLRDDGTLGDLGPMVDLFVAGWSSGQRWSVREEGDDELPSGHGSRCQGTQPTAISMLGQVPPQEIPPFRLDYMLAGPPSVCQGAHSACRVLNSTTTMGLSDHFPIMCALSL
jgi:endonuclease/exonuclease/phosphatase family metal-dependent hydrolase